MDQQIPVQAIVDKLTAKIAQDSVTIATLQAALEVYQLQLEQYAVMAPEKQNAFGKAEPREASASTSGEEDDR